MSANASPLLPCHSGGIPFYVGVTLSRWGIIPVDGQEMRYQTFPTLIQLRDAFEWSPLIRRDILAHLGRGEHLATFVDYRAHPPAGTVVPAGYLYAAVVHRPESIIRDHQGEWQYEGGEVMYAELPPSGWGLLDRDGRVCRGDTGLPTMTTPDRSHAVEVLGEERTVYFERGRPDDGFLGTSRLFRWSSHSHPWGLYANTAIHLGSPRLGARFCVTNEEDASRWAAAQAADRHEPDMVKRLSDAILSSLLDGPTDHRHDFTDH